MLLDSDRARRRDHRSGLRPAAKLLLGWIAHEGRDPARSQGITKTSEVFDSCHTLNLREALLPHIGPIGAVAAVVGIEGGEISALFQQSESAKTWPARRCSSQDLQGEGRPRPLPAPSRMRPPRLDCRSLMLNVLWCRKFIAKGSGMRNKGD